jgi:sugar/nucleoside kinase (ribokinase family)
MQDHAAVVVAGGFGIDTNVYARGERVGAEVTFAHVVDAPGQAGCYSARAFAALGLATRAIAALGEDAAAGSIRDDLATRGVALTELRDPLGTHRSVNIVAADGTRRNYFDARGAALVAFDAVACRQALRGARLLHCHLDDWCRQLLPLAHRESLLVSCDLQDATHADDDYRADFVAAADILFVSAANLADPAAVANELAGRRAGRTVVVGAGAQGCLVATAGRVTAYAAARLPTPVIDTNGAGDTLAATFLACHVLEGLTIEDAVRRAQLAARWTCAPRGDEKTPLPRAALEALATRPGPDRAAAAGGG